MVKGPKFCRGHEMEPKERRRRSGVRLGQTESDGFWRQCPLRADGCDWSETGQLGALDRLVAVDLLKREMALLS